MTAEYEPTWRTLELEETIEVDQTIVSKADDWRDTLRSSLPRLPLGAGAESQFELAGVLGRGGMGIVHEAHQRSLAREVAIKTVHAERISRNAENALLQEARVMGAVEHPNVVPVHIIGQDDNGRPVIVMKKVDGTPWLDYIRGEAEIEGDLYAFHLEVARAVCRALSFAHDRGILHRDIKPENVMIGRFGEVYLLDWGVAVALRENSSRIPLAEASDEVVGTPAFMPPEMTTGRGADLSERTDVFLLGASLYSAVTGQPPNRGDSLIAVMSFSFLGQPREYPASVPTELREILETAMAHDPADRFGSCDEFRVALEDFESHRSSHLLVQDARVRLDALRVAIDRDDEDQVNQIFGEARFGFATALRIWEENPDAIDGLVLAIEAMIRWELDNENLKSARALYLSLSRPNDELAQAIEELEAELEARGAKLEKIAYDYDESVGIGERKRVIGLLGVSFFFAPAGKWLVVEAGQVPVALRWLSTDPTVLVSNLLGVFFLPVFVAIIYITLTRYRDHKVSRIFALALFEMYLLGMGARTSTIWADVSVHLALAAELTIYCSGLFALALSIDRRIGRAAFIIAPTIVLMLALPGYGFEIYYFGLGLACLGFATFRNTVSIMPKWDPHQ